MITRNYLLKALRTGIERHGHESIAEEIRTIADRIVTEASGKVVGGHTLACVLCGDTSRCVLTDEEMRFVERARDAGEWRIPITAVERLAGGLGVRWSAIESHAREAYNDAGRAAAMGLLG
jgi:hypothetical protein